MLYLYPVYKKGFVKSITYDVEEGHGWCLVMHTTLGTTERIVIENATRSDLWRIRRKINNMAPRSDRRMQGLGRFKPLIGPYTPSIRRLKKDAKRGGPYPFIPYVTI